jgi:hypothetical protein
MDELSQGWWRTEEGLGPSRKELGGRDGSKAHKVSKNKGVCSLLELPSHHHKVA